MQIWTQLKIPCQLEDLICETGIKTKESMQNISTGEILAIGGQDFLISTRFQNDLHLPNTLLYALNFIDGGFAILSANTNLNDPVICITDAGKVFEILLPTLWGAIANRALG